MSVSQGSSTHLDPRTQFRNRSEWTSPSTTMRGSACGQRAQCLYLFLVEGPAYGGATGPQGWVGVQPFASGAREKLTLARERAALSPHTGQSRRGNHPPGSVLEQRRTGVSKKPLGSLEPRPRPLHSAAHHTAGPAEGRRHQKDRWACQTEDYPPDPLEACRSCRSTCGGTPGPPPKSRTLRNSPRMLHSFPCGLGFKPQVH